MTLSTFSAAVATLAYPVGDLALLAVLASIRARSAGHLGLSDLSIAAAVAIFVVGDIGYARLVATDSYEVGHPVDLAWSIAFVLVALAAGRALVTTKGKDESDVTVPLLAVFGVGGQVLLATVAIYTRLEDTVVLAGAAAAGLLLVARLVILLFDRASLLRAHNAKVAQLEGAHSARERFIATVSHDLRSPLASISGFAELLREPEIAADPAQVAEMTSSIERNARRLARLTEDLLCAGQFASGHPPPLKLTAVDLRQTAEEVVSDMGRNDDVVVQGRRWIYVMADRQRVQQILTNLIENAFKHSGSTAVTVSVQANEDGAAFEVTDCGVGIETERFEEIFDPFVSDYTRASSAGLGLYVVANLVTAMNGRISVTSEVGHGTTFHVVLPSAVPEAAFPNVKASAQTEQPSR